MGCPSVRNLQAQKKRTAGQIHTRTSGEDEGPASPGPSEEGRLCGWGTGAKPASETSTFLTLEG